MKEYVAGFLFNEPGWIWMVEKNRPVLQAGLLNGIGGKVEPTDATPYDAMVREFKEEVYGAEITGWELFCRLKGAEMNGDPFVIYFYRKDMDDNDGFIIQQAFEKGYRSDTESERILNVPQEGLMRGEYPMMRNVPWLMMMAHERCRKHWPYKVEQE